MENKKFLFASRRGFIKKAGFSVLFLNHAVKKLTDYAAGDKNASFIPSITQVATAIPAFIGYTQTAPKDNNGNTMTNIPIKVNSFFDYVNNFGLAQAETGIQVTYVVENDNTQLTVTNWIGAQSLHNMYYSIRNFYDNGGGPCYIVSIGPYKPIGNPLSAADFSNSTALPGAPGSSLNAIAKIPEITLIVLPEAQNLPANTDYYKLQQSALAQCGTLKNRFCIMDMYGPGTAIKTQNDLSKSVSDFRQHFSSPANPNLSYGAVYFPNLVTAYPYVYDEPSTKVVSNIPQLNNQTLSHVKTVNPAVYNILTNAINSQLPVILPPSPGVAGIYNATDMARGVWKSPANAAVIGVTSLTYPVTDALQGSLNTDPNTGIAINAIRSFTGKGILIWGASTLDGNNNSFQYLSVRRFFIMVEASVNNALNAMAFMPDNQATWTTVRTMTENFLTNLWRQGALAGAKPEQAFFVKVGLGQTMTAADVQNHKLIVEIGMAVLKPAEFVILSITALTA